VNLLYAKIDVSLFLPFTFPCIDVRAAWNLEGKELSCPVHTLPMSVKLSIQKFDRRYFENPLSWGTKKPSLYRSLIPCRRRESMSGKARAFDSGDRASFFGQQSLDPTVAVMKPRASEATWCHDLPTAIPCRRMTMVGPGGHAPMAAKDGSGSTIRGFGPNVVVVGSMEAHGCAGGHHGGVSVVWR
jgi:hypothetical protein